MADHNSVMAAKLFFAQKIKTPEKIIFFDIIKSMKFIFVKKLSLHLHI